MKLYPLALRPVFKPKIWGGRGLQTVLSKDLPAGLIGESWEIADEAIVANGALAGQRLGELAARYGGALVGSIADPCGGLPLLVKFIDARDRLSVQVHPDDDSAREVGADRGKTEAWYVLSAEPNAEIIHGFTDPTPDREHLYALARDGGLSACLQHVPVAAGDVIFIPAGTIHAMGAGLVICEVQQNCDITYRMYDWGRLGDGGRPRDLHIEQAVAVSRHAPREHKIATIELNASYGRRSLLVACRYFVVELLDLLAPVKRATSDRSFAALCSLEGNGQIRWEGGSLPIERGESGLVPAEVGQYELRPSGSWRVLLAYIPDLALDVVGPLIEAGIAERDIQRLGGDEATNDLAGLLRL